MGSVLLIDDLQFSICIYFSEGKGVEVGVSVIDKLRTAICIYFNEVLGCLIFAIFDLRSTFT